jgi:hypothetical protein
MSYVIIEELHLGTWRRYTPTVLGKKGHLEYASRFKDIKRIHAIQLQYGVQIYGCANLGQVSSLSLHSLSMSSCEVLLR